MPPEGQDTELGSDEEDIEGAVDLPVDAEVQSDEEDDCLDAGDTLENDSLAVAKSTVRQRDSGVSSSESDSRNS